MILGNGQITANGRPNFPWQTAHTNTRDNKKLWKVDRPVPINYEIPMDWHHIVPWNVLRDGWSALASSGRWEVLAAWATLWNLGNVNDIVTSMRQGTLGPPNNSNMWDKLCWTEWNLVEGPTNLNRTDDPGGDGLDAFEGKKIPNNLRDRSSILKSIYTQMRSWSADKNDINEQGAKNLLGCFEKIKAYKRSPIHMFDPEVWELVTPGRINKYGMAEKHPTWRKRL